MKITEGPLAGLLIVEPKVFTDSRGCFFEVFKEELFTPYNIPSFKQDNVSYSQGNVLRGLHYQKPNAQGKLIWVTQGTVWDIVVDIRRSSKTFGQWFNMTLSAENHLQLYIPPGFAHGFCVLSPDAVFHYKCTDYYAPGAEHGIAWNDKALNIPWPLDNPILSPKDERNPRLEEIKPDELFA